ncbi:MAG: hypothetical protein Q4G48_04135 [Bacteroidia bacterium]|nr:hypothetical protein [Bacteroidia bacterium]
MTKRKRNKSGCVFFILLAIIVLAVAIFTNPDAQAHKEALKAKSNAIMDEIVAERNDALSATAWQLAGTRLLNEFIETNLTVDNYYLFSVPKVNWDGKSYPVGVGAFGYVYITNELNKEVVQPIIDDMEEKISNTLPDILKQFQLN